MAFQDVKRAIRNAPYRHTWVFRDANGNVLTNVSSITAQRALDTCGLAEPNPALVVGNQSNTLYFVDLPVAQMTADLIELYITGSGARAEYAAIKTEPALDSGVVAAATVSGVTLASTAVGTDDYYNGAQIEIVRGVGAGQIRAIVDYTASRVVTLDRNWITTPNADSPYVAGTTSVYIIHPRTGVPLSTGIRTAANILEVNGDAAAAVMMGKFYVGAFIASAVNDASPTTTTFVGGSELVQEDNRYKDMFVVFTSGTLKGGPPRRVTAYAADRTITTDAFPVAPVNGDTFILLALVV